MPAIPPTTEDLAAEIDRELAAEATELVERERVLAAQEAPPASEVFSAVLPSARQPHHTYSPEEAAGMAKLSARIGKPLEHVLAVGLAAVTNARLRAAPSTERDQDLGHLTKVLCYIHSAYDIPQTEYTTKLLGIVENLNLDASQFRPTNLAKAYVRTNPERLTLDQLAAKLRIPRHVANNMRMATRTQNAYRDRMTAKETGAELPPARERIRSGYLLPLHWRNPVFYHETTPAGDEATETYKHVRSPLYIFHAMAWGWRTYADYLESVGRDICPYSNLDVSQLRRENPSSGAGIAAYVFAANALAEKATGGTVTLPMPAYNCAAHEYPAWEEDARQSPHTGVVKKPKYTRLATLKKMIIAECPPHRLKDVFGRRALIKIERLMDKGKL